MDDSKPEEPPNPGVPEGTTGTPTELSNQEAEKSEPAELSNQEAEKSEPAELSNQKVEKSAPAELSNQKVEKSAPAELSNQEAENSEPAELSNQSAEKSVPAELSNQKVEKSAPAELSNQSAEKSEPAELSNQEAEKSEPAELSDEEDEKPMELSSGGQASPPDDKGQTSSDAGKMNGDVTSSTDVEALGDVENNNDGSKNECDKTVPAEDKTLSSDQSQTASPSGNDPHHKVCDSRIPEMRVDEVTEAAPPADPHHPDRPPTRPTSLLVSPSRDPSRPSSSATSPLASPCKNSVLANKDSDAATAQTLEDIQGDIHTVISQSQALITSGPPSPAGSDDDELLSALDSALTGRGPSPSVIGRGPPPTLVEGPNGVRQTVTLAEVSEYKQLRAEHDRVVMEHSRSREDIARLSSAVSTLEARLSAVTAERDEALGRLAALERSSNDEVYQAQTRELELTIVKNEQELKATKEKLEAHDNAAKRAVASLQNELKTQVDRVKTLYEDCRREKEAMTMKYAQAESKNIEVAMKLAKADQHVKDVVKEREAVIGRFKAMKADKVKVTEMYEARAAEFGALRREIEKSKEAIQSADNKIKWHQNKIKAEQDAHKDTLVRVEDLQRKLKQAKEETDMIRRDFQEAVKTYQESDEIESNSLGKKLREREETLKQELQEKSDQKEVHQTVMKELDTLKRKHKDTMEELKTMKDRVTCLEAERITQEHTLDRFRETLQTQKRDNKDLQDKISRLDAVDAKLASAETLIQSLEGQVSALEQTNCDLAIDMEGCSGRESEHLEFSQKVSDKNALLQSENNALNTRVIGVTAEQERLSALCGQLQAKLSSLEKELTSEKTKRSKEVLELTQALQSKSKAVEELSRKVEEEKDEIRTLKRKHTANVKDVTRQLQQCRRRLEALDQARGGAAPGTDSLSAGSRTSSNGSLDTVGNHGNHGNHGVRAASQETMPDEAPPLVEVIEVDKQMLMEKIVRLQKSHARKNEKMEFMDDHINQLVQDIQRKTRIIQNYVMREEAGTLASESMDHNKAQLSRKGGIMASVYSSQPHDGAMTLDLSLQINHKLQSVLEDTLLKNITLKENLETLGEEIARISQENRRLQLSLQSQNASAAS